MEYTDTRNYPYKPYEEKILGKIASVEFGLDPDRPYLYGLKLSFSAPGFGVESGSRYMVDISPNREDGECALEAFNYQAEEISMLLKDAKCKYVSELKNKPVEIKIVDKVFKDFRILTEVL